MNINSVNSLNTNINQNNTCKNLRISPNFTSITPAKIFKGGVLVTDIKTFRKTIRAFFKDLTQYKYKVIAGEKGSNIISKFKDIDKQLNLTLEDNGKILREYVDKKDYLRNGVFHFFTGGQAENLNKLGRKIGKVWGGYSDSSLSEVTKAYFDRAREFIKFKNQKLGTSYDYTKSIYNDDKLGMHILVTEVPIDKKRSKLVIDDIKFRRIEKQN